MISFDDQNDLFELISSKLKKDVICYVFGGTAMLFYGYKDITKDIDIIFSSKEDKDEFLNTIKFLGYKLQSLKGIYDNDHLLREGKPVIYTRGDERFDIFFNKIFATPLLDSMKNEFYAKYDYSRGNNTLTLKALSKESIILLKSVTDRERDFEDIILICKNDNVSWEKITDMAIEASKSDKWIVLDLEDTMKRLKKEVFIPEKYFKKLYEAI